jgi:ubiquinone/menaquinone biosynthesis C-methylase UbiE
MAMDRETGAWVLDLLTISDSDAVLEIGSGPGVALELAAKRLPHGRIVGVDSSQTMFDMARHRNQQAIEAGRVDVKLGTADKLPFGHATFDAALTINSLHLWTDPLGALREIRRTMRPGGRIAIAISRFSHESSEGFMGHLTDAGFERANIQTSEHGTCAIARAPSEEKE